MKKFLLFFGLVIGIPLIVGGCFMGFAATVDEFTYTTHVQVGRPIAEVWEVMQDAEKLPEWLEGLESIELVSGGHLEVGSVWLLRFEMDGRPFEMRETVTACGPPNLYAFDADSDFFSGHTEIRLSEAGDFTNINTTNSMAGKNALFRAVFYIQRGMIEEQAEGNFTKLKDLIESSGA